MPKMRPPYPRQFRARLIELARNGRRPEEFGEEREEVRQFRRENKTLREEREILKKLSDTTGPETPWASRLAPSPGPPNVPSRAPSNRRRRPSLEHLVRGFAPADPNSR